MGLRRRARIAPAQDRPSAGAALYPAFFTAGARRCPSRPRRTPPCLARRGPILDRAQRLRHWRRHAGRGLRRVVRRDPARRQRKDLVGAHANIEEGATLHTDIGFPLDIGDDCTIGHNAILHGCAIGARARRHGRGHSQRRENRRRLPVGAGARHRGQGISRLFADRRLAGPRRARSTRPPSRRCGDRPPITSTIGDVRGPAGRDRLKEGDLGARPPQASGTGGRVRLRSLVARGPKAAPSWAGDGETFGSSPGSGA